MTILVIPINLLAITGKMETYPSNYLDFFLKFKAKFQLFVQDHFHRICGTDIFTYIYPKKSTINGSIPSSHGSIHGTGSCITNPENRQQKTSTIWVPLPFVILNLIRCQGCKATMIWNSKNLNKDMNLGKLLKFLNLNSLHFGAGFPSYTSNFGWPRLRSL